MKVIRQNIWNKYYHYLKLHHKNLEQLHLKNGRGDKTVDDYQNIRRRTQEIRTE